MSRSLQETKLLHCILPITILFLFYVVCLDLCRKHKLLHCIFPNTQYSFRLNALQFGEPTTFSWESDTILELRCFTRRHTFRKFGKVWHTWRDKHGACTHRSSQWYGSAFVAFFFDVYRILIRMLLFHPFCLSLQVICCILLAY